jgi:hypothetical protein
VPEPPEFEHCLRCGQPLQSWLSRHDGFGLHCAESLSRRERYDLVRVARAVATDLQALERGPRRPSIPYRLAILVLVFREWRRAER